MMRQPAQWKKGLKSDFRKENVTGDIGKRSAEDITKRSKGCAAAQPFMRHNPLTVISYGLRDRRDRKGDLRR